MDKLPANEFDTLLAKTKQALKEYGYHKGELISHSTGEVCLLGAMDCAFGANRVQDGDYYSLEFPQFGNLTQKEVSSSKEYWFTYAVAEAVEAYCEDNPDYEHSILVDLQHAREFAASRDDFIPTTQGVISEFNDHGTTDLTKVLEVLDLVDTAIIDDLDWQFSEDEGVF